MGISPLFNFQEEGLSKKMTGKSDGANFPLTAKFDFTSDKANVLVKILVKLKASI